MKSFLFFLILFFAFESYSATVKIFVISPPKSISWKNPKDLLLGTVRNSVKSSYMSNGHVAIQLLSDTPNEFGAKNVLTSMASLKPINTSATTLFRGLGLASLSYDFPGKLDSAERTEKLITMARKDKRLAQMTFEVSEKRMEEMFLFLNDWISHGSFKHYMGGQIAGEGRGAGCADFVMHFMNIILSGKAPLKTWMREVYLPPALMGAPGNWVSPVKIIRFGKKWATPAEGIHFMIPDPALIFDWIKQRDPVNRSVTFAAWDIEGSEVHHSAHLIRNAVFAPTYPMESLESMEEQWSKIQTDRLTF